MRKLAGGDRVLLSNLPNQTGYTNHIGVTGVGQTVLVGNLENSSHCSRGRCPQSWAWDILELKLIVVPYLRQGVTIPSLTS